MSTEMFLKLYLEEHKLKHSFKNNIYTIKLDSAHKKWFNADELKLTFDPRLNQKEVVYLTKGHSFINTMLMQHLDNVPIASLNVEEEEDGLIELNERLTEISEMSSLYQIDEQKEKCIFTYFEVTVNTAKHKSIFKLPLLKLNNQIIDASGIENVSFKDNEAQINPEENYLELFNEISNIIKPDLDKLSDEHAKDMKELIKIQQEHNAQQFSELIAKEEEIMSKITRKESDEVAATTFERKGNIRHTIKALKTKHKKLVDANNIKRKKITEDSMDQMSALSNRDLNVEVNILAYAEISLNYHQINYENGDKYFFIPCLHKFVKSR